MKFTRLNIDRASLSVEDMSKTDKLFDEPSLRRLAGGIITCKDFSGNVARAIICYIDRPADLRSYIERHWLLLRDLKGPVGEWINKLDEAGLLPNKQQDMLMFGVSKTS